MERSWLVLILVVLGSLTFLFLLLKKNHKDKKGLFKKMPGDYPDPKFVKSEFDKKD
jgi:hypothetical protein